MILAALVLAVLPVQGIEVRMADGSGGQLCPESPETAWTARHVVDGHNAGQWSGPVGTTGTFEVIWRAKDSDLVRLRSDVRFPFWYGRARKPNPGQILTVFGHGMFADGWYPLIGRFLGERGDEITFGQATMVGHPGMSGGCVLDSRGDIVGIFLGSIGPDHFTRPEIPWMGRGTPLWKGKEVR